MDIKLIVALIGLSGVLASAFTQYYLGRKSERNKNVLEVRTQAYLDLINSVAELASSAKHGAKRNREQLATLIQAKSRVVLIGSNDVVLALHHFFENYPSLSSDEAYRAFSKIVAAMRSDLSGDVSLDESVLVESLFDVKQNMNSKS
ncbi:hypothetical protein [Aliagarivorans taiwanensis]|uniref:hypothetical protein n=1 Tax=Aliagarivorans taiwanensis TaxID=561966 RepID=UPI00047A8335|nr:hypothetical protein [Aliagarivorans taiwanensis]